MFIILSCANPKPPSGGEPNRIPPKVIDFYPLNYMTNFRKNNIEITFNKWVERGSVVNNIFLNPPANYQIGWSGKTLEIKFTDGLDSNTTYSLLIGTGYSDLDQNKAQEPFALVFSTGAHIDSGRIAGKIIADDMTTVFVYAFPAVEFDDTLKDVEQLFHYKTQPNQNGDFSIEAMKNGKYFILAFKDRNNNKIYDGGIDDFGIYSQETDVTNVIFDTCKILLRKAVDFVKPELVDIEAFNSRILKLRFSEPVSFNDSLFHTIVVVDTSNKKSVFPLLGFVNPEEKNTFFLFVDSPLSDAYYYLSIEALDVFKDTIGNRLDYRKKLVFKGNSAKDQQKPRILIEKQYKINTLTDKLHLGFSKPIDTTRSKINVLAIGIAQKDTLKGNLVFVNSFTAMLEFGKLKWNNRYKLYIKIDTLFDIYGMVNSNLAVESELLIFDQPVFGSLQGRVLPFGDTVHQNLRIAAFNKSNFYVSKIEKGLWRFENLPEGTYTLIVFQDFDNDGQYFYGSLKPFKLSEKIFLVKPNIQVKRSWTVESIDLWMKAR